QGSIRAENWEQGAHFTILLPKGNPAVLLHSPEKDKNVEQVQQKFRALVVDDEETLVTMQTAFLADIGVQAAGAFSGADALLHLQSNHVDLVISDVRMPGTVDGIQLYEWIGRNQPHLLKRFLFVSGDMIGI